MPAFICNGMLGKLCKLMRMCGLDTAYSNEGTAILIHARREDRIILTRNTRFKDKEHVHYMKDSDPSEQLRRVIKEYHLEKRIKFLSRCLECNTLLRPVDKVTVQDRIPYYTYTHFTHFAECPNCHKIYWKGSHYKRMIDTIDQVLETMGIQPNTP